MKKITIIGTIHLHWTPRAELWEVLDEINPDHVLVELSPEELHERPRSDSIRDEMFAAYDWAIKNHKLVSLFDSEDSPLKDGVQGTEEEFVTHEQACKQLLQQYSWKDLNNQYPWETPAVKEIEESIKAKYFDETKSQAREQKMLAEIKRTLIEGNNVVVTGAGHLTFFEKALPEAIFPFRAKHHPT